LLHARSDQHNVIPGSFYNVTDSNYVGNTYNPITGSDHIGNATTNNRSNRHGDKGLYRPGEPRWQDDLYWDPGDYRHKIHQETDPTGLY
jgi:hypothetical protein